MKKMCLIGVLAALTACHHPIPINERYPALPEHVEHPPGGSSSSPVKRAPSLSDRSRSEEEFVPLGELPRDVTQLIGELNGQLQDAFFDYDHADVTPDAMATLRRDADLLLQILADFPKLRVIVEGHCDERGSAEYNLALGDRRATRAAEILHELGVPLSAAQTVSFGKEAPQCAESSESCWQRNRRAHLEARQ